MLNFLKKFDTPRNRIFLQRFKKNVNGINTQAKSYAGGYSQQYQQSRKIQFQKRNLGSRAPAVFGSFAQDLKMAKRASR